MNSQETFIKVWDLPVRFVHWAMVVLIGVSWWTGTQGGELMTYHMWSGYTLLTLVLFRIVWGFIGSSSARFCSFLRGPRAIIGYLKTLPQRKAHFVAGHNPLGAISVVLLLLALLLQTVTGLFANDDIFTEGPLYLLVSKATSDLLTTVHKYNFDVLLALIAVHIAAVLYYLFYKSENLVKPMFTGSKRAPPGAAVPALKMAGLAKAVVLLAIVATAVYLLVRQ